MIYTLSLNSCAQKNKEKNTTIKFEINKTDEEWKKTLTDKQFYILREKGTDKPYSGEFLFNKDKGNYTCAACGNILFSSDSKFDSHCGWPSFDQQINSKAIVTKEDNSAGMQRTEIMCGKCGGHLGHIFDDGPTETGMRYCVNSTSLTFEKATDNTKTKLETITLGGGCFWCMEAVFQELKGVKSIRSGFSGGISTNTNYKDVCSGITGHAEVIEIEFDSSVISLAQILKVFFTVHDPTSLNKQVADEGTQYRSAIFYRNDQQKKLASQEILNQIHLLKFWHPKGDRPIIPNRRSQLELKEFQKILANPQIF
jgi:peptide methionine sulfoxide reductase msrA/msrB